MQISWKGQACFVVTASRGKQEQVQIVIDPYGEQLGIKLVPVEADIALVTHDHFDHNNVSALKGDPFVITNPGEYDVKGVAVQGIHSFHDAEQGKERGSNTMYVLEVEGLRLCHLGDLGQKELTSEQVDAIGNIDILFVPVGGTYTITAQEAVDIMNQVEPRIVIPMHYALPKLKVKLAGVEQFLEVFGKKDVEAQPKLVMKQKDIKSEGETEIVVLKS